MFSHAHRLENDFIVFRGGEHESAGQLVKGVIVLCLPSSLKLEDVHLRLTGTLRIKCVPPPTRYTMRCADGAVRD